MKSQSWTYTPANHVVLEKHFGRSAKAIRGNDNGGPLLLWTVSDLRESGPGAQIYLDTTLHAPLYETIAMQWPLKLTMLAVRRRTGVDTMSHIFSIFRILPLLLLGFILGGCTSDPYAPINRSSPIRQMDNAFDPSGSRYYDRAAPAPYPRGNYDSPSYSRY
jgi:hypothetical protein